MSPFTRKSLFRRIRKWFFAGLLVAAPMVITIYLVWLVISTMDEIVKSVFPGAYLPMDVPGIGLLIVLLTITLLGMAVSNFFGGLIIHWWDQFMKRMPVISSVYSSIKQFFEAILSDKSNTFKEVVLVQYPYKGCWSIGFVTGLAPSYANGLSTDVMTAVFLPTMPVPTAGFLLIVPDHELHRPNLTVEEGLKLVLSIGLVAPPGIVPQEIAFDHKPTPLVDREIID